MTRDEVITLIREVAGWLGLPSDLAIAQAEAESSLNPAAVSSAGALGLFQIEPNTAKSLLFEPEVSAFVGLFYLRKIYQGLSANSEADRWTLALASYNAGPGRVKEARDKAEATGADPGSFGAVLPYLPEETQKYAAGIWMEFQAAMNPQA